MELDLGNVMGPQGPRGSLIYYGTAITGTSTSGTIFSGSGIANAMVDDKYLNTSTGDFYTCTTSGAPSVARWAWIVNLLGPQGNVGPAGPTGQIDENTPITFSTPSTYSAPASGNTIAVLFGKITKGLSDLFASVAAKLDSSKVIASTNITQTGYVMDGKTCSDAIAQLNDDITGINTKLRTRAINSGTLLNAALNLQGNGILFFSSDHTPNDVPQSVSEAFTIIIKEHNSSRMHVVLYPYSSPDTNIYTRSIYDSNWLDTWHIA